MGSGNQDIQGIATGFALAAATAWVAFGSLTLKLFIDTKKDPIFYAVVGALIITFVSFQVYLFISQIAQERDA